MAIELEFTLDATPDRVWAVVGDPGRTDWVPGVESCVFDGSVRRLRMQGAGHLAERILLRDPARRRLEYSVIESDPPLADHLATLQVDPDPSGTRLSWTTRVEPQAVEPFIRRRMTSAIDRLREVLAADRA